MTRAARDALLADPATPTSIRMVPHTEGGRPAGMRLYGIRRTSVAGALGFQNGDTILDVNGRSVATPDAALEAYSELRDADRLEVHLLRRGEPRTLVVTIVETLGAPAVP